MMTKRDMTLEELVATVQSLGYTVSIDLQDPIERAEKAEAERDEARELLKAARSYIPRTGLVDHADLLADIAKTLGES